MDDPRGFYKETVLRILGHFQLLEFALKAYISHAYALIKASVGESVHFDYSGKDVQPHALGRLLSLFSKLNANTELVKRLSKLKDERDHIAHQSLLITLGPMYDRGTVEDKSFQYTELEDEVTECLKLVIEEARVLKEKRQSEQSGR